MVRCSALHKMVVCHHCGMSQYNAGNSFKCRTNSTEVGLHPDNRSSLCINACTCSMLFVAFTLFTAWLVCKTGKSRSQHDCQRHTSTARLRHHLPPYKTSSGQPKPALMITTDNTCLGLTIRSRHWKCTRASMVWGVLPSHTSC